MNTLTNHSDLVRPALTDLYGPRMALGYFKNGVHEAPATFEVFFRKNAQGQFTILGGLDEVQGLLENFKIDSAYLDFIATQLPASAPKAFFDWLKNVNLDDIKIKAARHGVVHPRVPLMTITGPVGIGQMLETPILNCIGYPSMVATRAAQLGLAVDEYRKGIELLEFGLRRAPGPDGGVIASKYAYMGGFDATSNVLACQLFNIPSKGTNAHAFISYFESLDEITYRLLAPKEGGEKINFVNLVLRIRKVLAEKLSKPYFLSTNEGELAGMIAYALAFPDMFLTLVDTYNTLTSGLPNYLSVAYALKDLGYDPLGIRIDSDDLAYLSREARKLFDEADGVMRSSGIHIRKHSISGSNDIDEEYVRNKLNPGRHEFNSLGIGTYLVNPPPMGVVYKLVVANNQPRIKAVYSKMILPGLKNAYRLYGEKEALVDLITTGEEPAPTVNQRILCRHPMQEEDRVNVTAKQIEPLLTDFWDRKSQRFPSLENDRTNVFADLKWLREDFKRPISESSYKVSVSQMLYDRTHQLWSKNSPIPDVC